MDTSNSKSILKKVFDYVASIISWTVFTLLIICLLFLFYYFVCTKLLATKGDKYEPFFSLYTIVSPSMTPNINVYDVIVNLKVKEPSDIGIGDVITFVSESPECLGATVTHRVIGIETGFDGKISYQTKGDANLIADSALAPYENVIGKVSYKIPKLGRIQFFLASKAGWLLLIFLPAVYVLLRALMRNIKKYVNLDKYADKWWFKFLNKPLLTGKKMKLLPEPEMDSVNVDGMDMPQVKNDNVIKNDETCFDLPVLNKENIENKVVDKVDDSTQIDLPILKK